MSKKDFFKTYEFEIYNKPDLEPMGFTDTITIFYDEFTKGYIWEDENVNQGDTFKKLKDCLKDAIAYREEQLNCKLYPVGKRIKGKKYIFIITNLELDNTYSNLYELDHLNDKLYKEYVSKHGNVYTLEQFIKQMFRYGFIIPLDDNERDESLNYRILKE